jgi:hypothetical protein
MLVFFIKLFLSNLIGDFLLQPTIWVERKRKKKEKSPYLYMHIAIHAIVLLVVLQFKLQYWPGILIILVTHFIIDLIKIKLYGRFNERLLFFADQLMHLIIIGCVVYIYFPYQIDVEWLYSLATLLTLTALVFVTVVSSVIMKIVISRWNFGTQQEQDSLENAGAFIGILERLFIFCFIVLNYWEGIGFLLAAKSVFRFGDLSKTKDRKLTEYMLIGTFLSFGLAIASGLAYQHFLEIIKL